MLMHVYCFDTALLFFGTISEIENASDWSASGRIHLIYIEIFESYDSGFYGCVEMHRRRKDWEGFGLVQN